jgi:uncharacterized membrane protein
VLRAIGRGAPISEVTMVEQILGLLEQAGGAISLVGVLVIAGGFLLAAGRYVADIRRLDVEKNFGRFKVGLGHALLLGLEILVLADIIETITVKQTFSSLFILAGIVIIRTIVSWTLTLEVEGHWPWQTADGE